MRSICMNRFVYVQYLLTQILYLHVSEKLWNSFPEALRSNKKLSEFKRNIPSLINLC